MQDRTIDNALLALQRQGGAQGHMAEALLILRHVPISRIRQDKPFRRGQVKALVLQALKDGAQTSQQIGAVILGVRPDITRRQAAHRAYAALLRLEAKGLVRREGRVWGLAE